jgi:hypothetical protein
MNPLVPLRVENALILTDFTHLRYRHRLIIPVAAHINSRMFIVPCRLALPIALATKQKTLGFLILGSLEFGSNWYVNLHGLLDPGFPVVCDHY